MQSPKPSPSQPPHRSCDHKSQRRAFIAAPLAFWIVPMVALGSLGLAAGVSSFFQTEPAPGEIALDRLLIGSAVTFAERSKPWIDQLHGTPEADHSPIISQLSDELLAGSPERSTRAAVLIGTILASESLPPSSRDAAQGALLYRLTQRVDTGARWSAGTDVTAARGLDRPHGPAALQASTLETLTELAYGEAPHPSLAVRVECAATVLKLEASSSAAPEPSADGTTAFLLAVLRAETPAQVESPRTWPRITTLAWVKTRSAEALANLTGTENRFRPDGSWAHQVAEAARFEALLR